MKFLLAMSCLLACAIPTYSQQRPTIGVAFEGGGALALAYVGLIEWFEQHHIPIDYVAGTSMGGLVGAGVSLTDAMTLTAVTLLMLVVGLVAGFIPAVRAARGDPIAALRQE